MDEFPLFFPNSIYLWTTCYRQYCKWIYRFHLAGQFIMTDGSVYRLWQRQVKCMVNRILAWCKKFRTSSPEKLNRDIRERPQQCRIITLKKIAYPGEQRQLKAQAPSCKQGYLRASHPESSIFRSGKQKWHPFYQRMPFYISGFIQIWTLVPSNSTAKQ